jgi:HK97 gp10 family phage protein
MANSAKEINDKLKKMVNEQKEAVDLVIFNLGKSFVEDVKANFPKDTGFTADQFEISNFKGKKLSFIEGDNKFFIARFKKNNYIAFFQEFGTVKMPARPTIRPAWQRHNSKIRSAAIIAAMNVLKKYK